MKVRNYERIYHPSIGKIVYKDIGSGLIVDNIFNPKIQYELSSGRIIQSDITLEFNNQKIKYSSDGGNTWYPQLNRFIQFWSTSRYL